MENTFKQKLTQEAD